MYVLDFFFLFSVDNNLPKTTHLKRDKIESDISYNLRMTPLMNDREPDVLDLKSLLRSQQGENAWSIALKKVINNTHIL